HASLTGELARLDGAAEWGVRAYLTGYPGAGRPNDGPKAPGATGIEWMLHRRDAATARQAARQARELAAQDVHEVLTRHARECAVRPRPRGDADGVPVLEGAYLFDRGDEARLRADAGALARRHAEKGLRFQVTGPWPPYHFVRLSERISHG
ncbi:MAG TPA: GvpL/GvpF family gas vesicle protein, partial [Mycobacteriales bacterium]|nr:GvpL/GvpF family gas vesicle protein [Mycobacteriales bacterium]